MHSSGPRSLAQAHAEATGADGAGAPRAKDPIEWSTPEHEAYAELHRKYALLLEEAQYHKRRAEGLERENRRLLSLRSFMMKSKRQLIEQLLDAKEAQARERRERAAMEETLSEAYNEHLKMLVEQLRAQGGGAADDAAQGFGTRLIKKLQNKS